MEHPRISGRRATRAVASSAVRAPDATPTHPNTPTHIGIVERIEVGGGEREGFAFGFSRRILASWAIKNSGHVHVNSIKQHITYKPDYNHHHQQHLREGPFVTPEEGEDPFALLFGMQSSRCSRNSWTFGCLRLPLTFRQRNMLLIRPVGHQNCLAGNRNLFRVQNNLQP